MKSASVAMKLRLLILLIFLSQVCCFSQQDINTTSKVLKRVSSSWTSDSLANNRSRFKCYKEVLNSKIDTVTATLLLSCLGTPNRSYDTNHGHEYLYYVYDTTKLSKSKGFEVLYLTFLFDTKTGLLKKIAENVMP
jgi:hypothetical protein